MGDDLKSGFIIWLLSVWDDYPFADIVILILFLTVSIFFSLCLGALGNSSLNDVRKKSDHGNGKAEKALKILENDMKYIKCMRTGRLVNSAAGLLLSVITLSPVLTRTLTGVFTYFSGNENAAADQYLIWSICVNLLVFMTGCLIYLAFGFFLPEKIGEGKKEAMLIRCSGALTFFAALFYPLAVFSDFLSCIVLKITGNYTENDTNHRAEEEILMMVDEGEESGVIEENTKDMIENVFEFDDTSVGEIMTHRKDIVAVKLDSAITDAAKTAIESGKSRLPVYGDDIDDIVGILYVKDMLKYVSTNAPTEKVSREIIKEAVFVPESKRCSEMFEAMTENRTQIAVVVDEFGGTGGIITMEDLIESIVGNIQDEYDNEDEEIRKLDDRSFTVAGTTSLDEISELTGLDFEDEENDTVAGIMLDRMGHIPKSGEHPSIVIDGTRFTVQEVEDRRISKVLIVKAKK